MTMDSVDFGSDDDDDGEAPLLTGEQVIEYKILETLRLYPRISPSMMQTALGPQWAARFWRPILDRLITQGRVRRVQKAVVNELTGRYRTAVILCRPDDPYIEYDGVDDQSLNVLVSAN